MTKWIKGLLVLGVLLGLAYYFRAPLVEVWSRVQNAALPCSSPIAYSIGEFDERFGISKSKFAAAITQAEALWEQAAGRQLFESQPDGALKINLVYDYRQQATQKLQKIGVIVADTRASYDAMKAKYLSLKTQYDADKSAFEAAVAGYNQRQQAYNATVTEWNKRGGAPQATFDDLQRQGDALRLEQQRLVERQATLVTEVDNVNALVVSLNQVAANLNLNVDAYNEIGASRGEEFDEGVYKSDVSGREIDIYQYDTQAKLVRVLAHELGHALGLQHIDDTKAIMYRLNQGTAEKLTAGDKAALTALCGTK